MLGGPDAVTWWDVVRETERALGRDVPVLSVAPGDDIPGLPPVMVGLIASLATYDSPVDMEETARILGVTPTSLGAFVDRFVASAAG